MNLILTGYAVSNTFNGTKELDTGRNKKVPRSVILQIRNN